MQFVRDGIWEGVKGITVNGRQVNTDFKPLLQMPVQHPRLHAAVMIGHAKMHSLTVNHVCSGTQADAVKQVELSMY